jgi:hypothetical protein
VTAANVVPADWDTGNNSASGNINIVDLNTNIAEHGTASFFDQKGGFPLSHTFTVQGWLNGSLAYNTSDTAVTAGEEQDAQVSFYSGWGCPGKTNALPYQFPVDITYTETMDGAPVYTAKAIGITGQAASQPVNAPMCDSTAVTYVQQVGSAVADDYTFRVISNTFYDSASKPLSTYQQVDATRNAGDITYVSSQYQCVFLFDCSNPTNYYYWNSHSETVLGKLVTLGSTWVPSLSTQDAGGNGFGGSIPVSLSSSQLTSGQPNTCRNSGPDSDGYTYQVCSSSLTTSTVTQGKASY